MDLMLLRADRLEPKKTPQTVGCGVSTWEPSAAPVTDTGGGLDECLERGVQRPRASHAPASATKLRSEARAEPARAVSGVPSSGGTTTGFSGGSATREVCLAPSVLRFEAERDPPAPTARRACVRS